MSNKGFTITGPSTCTASKIQVLIFSGICTQMRESMSFFQPAVACYNLVCQRKRKRAAEEQSAMSAPPIRDIAAAAPPILVLINFPVIGTTSAKVIREYVGKELRATMNNVHSSSAGFGKSPRRMLLVLVHF